MRYKNKVVIIAGQGEGIGARMKRQAISLQIAAEATFSTGGGLPHPTVRNLDATENRIVRTALDYSTSVIEDCGP